MTSVRLNRVGRREATLSLAVSIDPGEVHLRLPAALAVRLGLQTIDWRWRGGRKVRYVGPVQVEALGRVVFCGAIVTGDEVVLGRIVLDSLDVSVDPVDGSLVANHAVPQSLAVCVRSMS